MLDAGWNYYGDHHNVIGTPDRMLAFEDSFPTMLARRMGLPMVHSTMVLEGGSVEVNGSGVML